MFKEERDSPQFRWEMIGDLDLGRPNLGQGMDVAVYRLMQFTLRDVLIQRLGVKGADEIFLAAGEQAGREFCRALVTPGTGLDAFLKEVRGLLQDLKIGILRVELVDADTGEITLTVAEDLDCSGLPVCEETVCTYDEGFLTGLVSQHMGSRFEAREIDCWCSGDRVCRFLIKPAA